MLKKRVGVVIYQKDNDTIELLNFVGGGWFMSREKGDFAEKRANIF